MAWTDALVEFVEKSALLRESIKRRGDDEHYAARVERMSKKLDALASRARRNRRGRSRCRPRGMEPAGADARIPECGPPR